MTHQFTFSEYATQLRDFIGQHLEGPPRQMFMGFNDLALTLFALQFENVPVYRQFCQARQATPSTVSRWDQIPALPVSAFKQFEISSLGSQERTTVFHSSGTTGQPSSRHFHNAESLTLYEASLLAWLRRHLLADLENVTESNDLAPPQKLALVILTPCPALALRSSLVHMFETVRREFGSDDSRFAGRLNEAGAWTLDLEATVFALGKSISAHRPIALLGTAFSFVHLLDHCCANNLRFRLAEGSRVMETGGYKGRSRSMPKTELHSLITNYLGVLPTHILCEYGMSELSSQAYDWAIAERGARRAECGVDQPQRLFQFPPWVRVQIVSPETGEPVKEGEVGLIRVFDLANVRSVLAVQTEDLGVPRGAEFELIGRAPRAEPRGCSLMAQ